MSLERPGTTAAPRATRRDWIGLAVLALPCMLYSMDLTVLNLAVPSLSEDLKPSATQLLWIVDIYGFLVAGCLLTMGTLGDRIGRRKLLMIGAVAFGLTSILAAFSTSPEMLIVSRALLGIAGATLAPSTLSLIRNMFLNPRQRTVAISVWVMSYSAGAAIGPLLGGILLEFFWWGSVFLLAVPVMVLLLALGPVLLPEFRDPNAGRPDLVSAALSLVAVLTGIYGLKQVAEHGLTTTALLSIVVALAAGSVFLRRQLTLPDPLIDVRLFRIRSFSASLITYMLGAFAMFGAYVYIAQYLQLVEGLSPLEAGLWTLPSAVAFIVGSLVTPLLLRHLRHSVLIAGGFVIGAIGFALLSQAGEAGFMGVVLGSFIFSLGTAPVFTLATDLIIGSAPPERAGAASAISESSAEFGGALGIAVLGSIGAAIYRGRMTDAVPGGLSADSSEAARSTLGGAVAAAESLTGQAASDLLEVSRAAFVESLEVTAMIGVVVMGVLAVVVSLVLGKVVPAVEVSEELEPVRAEAE